VCVCVWAFVCVSWACVCVSVCVMCGCFGNMHIVAEVSLTLTLVFPCFFSVVWKMPA